MFSLKKITCYTLATCLSIPTSLGIANAQVPSEWQESNNIRNLECQDIQGSGFRSKKEDIPVGFDIFGSVLKLAGRSAANGSTSIRMQQPVQTVCRLSGNTERPKYKTMVLKFAIPDNDWNVNGSVVRLSVYLNGQFYDFKDVAQGQQIAWPIDVSDSRSVAFEGKCIRPSTKGHCPAIHFSQDSLQ